MMKRRLLSGLLTLALVFSLLPTTALAADRTVNSASELQNAINNAGNGDTIKLGANITFNNSSQIQTVADVYKNWEILTYTLTHMQRLEVCTSVVGVPLSGYKDVYNPMWKEIKVYGLPTELRPEDSRGRNLLVREDGKIYPYGGQDESRVRENGDATTYMLIQDKNLTIDLNGYTINATHNDAYFSALFVTGNSNVTIKGNGGITSSGTAITANGSGATVTVNGGNFKGDTAAVASLYSAKVYLNGGTFTGASVPERDFPTDVYLKTVTTYNGTYDGGTHTGSAFETYKQTDTYEGTATRTVPCGTLFSEGGGIYIGETSQSTKPTFHVPGSGTLLKKGNPAFPITVRISRGIFDTPPNETYLALNCHLLCKDDGTYEVASQNDSQVVAQVSIPRGSTIYYTSLRKAAEMAQTGSTVTLLKDISGEQILNNNSTYTIDLKTYTINGNVTVKSGNVTIKGGTINYTGTGNALKTDGAGATLTANCTVNAPNGTALSAGYSNSGGTVNAVGGSYTGKLGTSGGTLIITGGRYKPNDPSAYLATGFYAILDSDRYYAVTDSPFIQIWNKDDLLAFAQKVNNGDTGANAVLMATIDLNGVSWTPIGTGTDGFIGTFNGNGHSIKNFNSTSGGLFERVGAGGVVSNVTINSGNISHNSRDTGAIANVCAGTIQYCFNFAPVTGKSYVGGIAGNAFGRVDCCGNNGNIKGEQYVGGIAGTSSVVTNCYNIGTIEATNAQWHGEGWDGSKYDKESWSGAGGICGSGTYLAGSTANNCYNYGTVKTNANHFVPVSINGSNNWHLPSTANGSSVPGGYTSQGKEAAAFASGEVAWQLNGNSSNGVWYQNLGAGGDPYPVLDPTHARVYKVGSTYTNYKYESLGNIAENVTVPGGTSKAAIINALPKTVQVNTNNTSIKATAELSWDTSPLDNYDPDNWNEQTFTLSGKAHVTGLMGGGEKEVPAITVKVKLVSGTADYSNWATPTKKTYNDGDALDFSGTKLPIKFDDAKQTEVTLGYDSPGVRFSGDTFLGEISHGDILHKPAQNSQFYLGLYYETHGKEFYFGLCYINVRSTDNTIQGIQVNGTEAVLGENGGYVVTLPKGSSLPEADDIVVTTTDKKVKSVTKELAEDSDDHWEITVKAESGATATYNLEVIVEGRFADLNQQAIDQLKQAWDNMEDKKWEPTQAEVQQGDSEDGDESNLSYENQLRAWLIQAMLDRGMNFPVDVTADMTFTAGPTWATAGTRTNYPGDNGSFTFSITFTATKGNTEDHKQVTFNSSEGIITATPYPVPDYTVHFDSQGGSTVADATVKEDTPIGSENAPADPTKTDYHFTGWYKEAACTTKWDMDGNKVENNPTTLYAGWSWSKTETTVDSIQHTVPDPVAGEERAFLMGDAITITASAKLEESEEPTTLTDDTASFSFYNGDPADDGKLIGTVPATGSMASGFTATLNTALTSDHGFEKNGTFNIYAVFSGNTALSESADSVALAIGTLTYPIPATPQVVTVTERKITLNGISTPAHATVEYGYVEGKDGTLGNWQESPVFTGLTPGTAYTFYARYKANAYYEETKTSDPSKTVYTLPDITPSNLPAGTVGVPYSATLTAMPANVEWNVVGSLPNGLKFENGAISGTPSRIGNFNFTVTVTTADGIKNSWPLSIQIGQGTPEPGEVHTYLGDTPQTTFIYGQTITVKGAIIPSASNSINNLMDEPEEDQVALFYGETQLTRPVTVAGNGTFTLTYPTGEGGIPIGEDLTITVRFGGSLDLDDANIPLTITLNAAGGSNFPATLPDNYRVDPYTAGKFIYTMPAVDGAEYRMDNGDWQSSNSFGEIEPQSTHTFYARMKGTDTQGTGEETSITITFDLLDNTDPIQLEVSVSGDSGSRTVTITPVDGAEYSFGNGGWDDSNTHTLGEETSITVAIRYKATATHNASQPRTETLDLSKRPQEALSFDPIGDKTYGDADFTLFTTGGSGDGAVTYESLDPDVISIDGDVATILAAGTARLQATKAEDENYNARTAEITVTVARKPLTITAHDQQVTVGDTMPELTYTVSGLVNNDTFSDPSISCPVNSDTSIAGRYTISISGGSLDNAASYDVRYQNGTLTIDTVAPTIYTVTFDSMGGTAVGPQDIMAGERVKEPDDPTRDGYHFAGWYSDTGDAWSFSDPVDRNMTLYAKWDSEPVYEIGGSVTGDDGSAAGIEITLKRGNTIVRSTTTDDQGKYQFFRVSPGLYNIVAERTVNQNGTDVQQTVTVLVEIVDQDEQAPEIKMPPTNVNSVLELPSNAPEIMVGGLTEEAVAAATEDGSVTTDIVTVSMKITPQELVTGTPVEDEKVQLQQEQNAIQEQAPGKTLDFIEFEVIKTVGDEEPEPMEQTNNVLEIVVAFDFRNKENVGVYRYHGTEAEALTPTVGRSSQGDGTYSLDRANGLIHIFAKKFSTYAIGYTVSTPSGGGGGGGVSTYSITIEDSDHGKVTSNRRSASSGTTITLTATPDEGYRLEEITVTDSRGRELELTDLGNGKYRFEMPARSVVVTAIFREVEQAQPWVNPFVDVAEGAWFYDAVRFVHENGLMAGTSSTTFSPNTTTTRGMIATILWRLSGSPVVNYLMDFTDVDPAAYYGEAIRWATSMGVVAGYGNGTFGPNDPITREQMAVMLFRYAQVMGYDNSARADLSGYTDAGTVSGYAVDAMAWAVEQGIISGTSTTTLTPKGQATRAQAAAMLMRFVEGLTK